MLWSKYKDEYRRNLSLAMPVVAAQLGQVVVRLADSAMVGRLGAEPLAAVSFGGAVFFILFTFGMGLAMGLTPLAGEAFARGKHRRVGEYLSNAAVLYPIVGLLIFAVQYALVPFMPSMNQPEEVIELAVPYYEWLVWSMIPLMIFLPFKQFLEGIGNTRVSMNIIVASNILNIALNWVFIYGNLGFEAMGAAGAGFATFVSRLVMPFMIVPYCMRKPQLRCYTSRVGRGGAISRLKIAKLLAVGLPIAAQMVMEGGTFALSSIMVGWIGTVELAANQVAIAMSSTAFMIVVGISAATTIRVSHEYGLRDLGALRHAATASFHIGLAWNMFTALIFIGFRHQIPMFFTSDPQVCEVISRLLIYLVAFQIFDGLQCLSIGVLRGMQDVTVTMVVAFISYILLNLPVGYLCAFVFGWGVDGIWVGFIVGLAVAALLFQLRLRYKVRRMAVEGFRV